MRLIEAAKAAAKRHWPRLSVRTILFGTLLFVAALPGVAAVGLRVYENTLVQQTEAELIAQAAVIAAVARTSWGDHGPPPFAGAAPPAVDLRTDPVLPPMPVPVPGPAPEARAATLGRRLAPVLAEAAATTLAGIRLLDRHGVVVAGNGDLGRSYAAVPEVARALAGRPATVLRRRTGDPSGLHAALNWLSRAATLRLHHVRPVIAGGRVVGAVMLSRSPRGLWTGVYQDRGKIALGVVLILGTLLFLAGLLSRGIARPLTQLSAATEQVAGGHLMMPDAPATAAAEIQDLYRHFGVMAARIERRQRYLRDFAAAVSHEFKTPLTGIRGALELLGEHDMDEATRLRFLRNAGADAARLSLLTARLLELARADMAQGDANAACDAALVARTVADRSDPRLAVRVDGDAPAPAAITADALATVIETLADNSCRAGAAALSVTVGRRDGRVLLAVSDDGPGVDPADAERIWEPFFTARRASGGTGLGLPIARSLLSSFGGSIDLVPGTRGATFRIDLPT